MLYAGCDTGLQKNQLGRAYMRKAANNLRTACGALLIALLLPACSVTPPRDQQDICRIFEQHPGWYDYARKSEKRWGVPPQILMSFAHFESNFRSNARPPRDWFLKVVPLPRQSSAYGYAQAQDPAWKDYMKETGATWFSDRDNMKDALDFIGWYNHKSRKELGISTWDAKNLYLAYHEGRAGYRSGAWRRKPDLINLAERVDWQAREYGEQLRQCEDRFKCDSWYQFWPFCTKQ
jgi:hypothetical protein